MTADPFLIAADLIDPPKSEKRLAWERVARETQVTPVGQWLVWLILAGRGWGKTRTGAEDVADYARTHPNSRIALAARTYADGRDTMVEGESGLLSVLHDSELRGGSRDRAWNRSLGELYLANGSRFKIYSSEKPAQLRGPQHHRAWADEVAQWLDAQKGDTDDTTWSNLMLGLRLGDDPRCIVTTTPKAYRLVKDLLGLPNVRITRGTTYENLANLAPSYKAQVIARYEGTRLGRQELYAEMLEEAPGALWTRNPELAEEKGLIVYGEPPLIEHELEKVAREIVQPLDLLRSSPELQHARLRAADLLRVVIGVDPAVTSGPESDETGIVIPGRASDGKAYVLDDRSLRASPNEWAHRVVNSLEDYKADRIVPEVNNGGELVTTVIRTIRPTAPITAVHASRGKRTRAEPVSALYQQGKVFHVRPFPELEDQMCTWEPGTGDDSPDRMDAAVWALTELMLTGNTGRVVQGPDIWG